MRVHPADSSLAADRIRFLKEKMPEAGLFAGHTWRLSPEPFLISEQQVRELEFLGRVLLQFYRSLNLLHRQSVEGKQPQWIASVLDQGKPESLLAWQRAPAFRHELPRVIRPDLLLTPGGFALSELDSVPGGIGLTAWLNQTYADLDSRFGARAGRALIGGREGMLEGFSGIFEGARQVHLVVSEESATYRPEMAWLAARLGHRFQVQNSQFTQFQPGDAVYRFFELFDLAQIASATAIREASLSGSIQMTPPPKPALEEKLMFALLWNRHLRDFWRRQLGERFLQIMQQLVPYTWLMDPAPLPPHGAIPELNLAGWEELKGLSQKQRDLILKISGFSEKAWGARGVYLGSDLSQADWSAAVEEALRSFDRTPYILQRYAHPALVEAEYWNEESGTMEPMPARVRLCPYYFVVGRSENARARLGGVLATLCPADKKILHGMRDAILAPCAQAE